MMSSDRNFTRGAALGDWIGYPAVIGGTIDRWVEVENGKAQLLLTTVEVRGGRNQFLTTIDHLWVLADIRVLRRFLLKYKATRLDSVEFLGRIEVYKRADGSRDIGVVFDKTLISIEDFAEQVPKALRRGRWQETVDLIDSGHIVFAGDTPFSEENARRAEKYLVDLREYCLPQIEKLQQSKTNDKPTGFKVEIPAKKKIKKKGFGSK